MDGDRAIHHALGHPGERAKHPKTRTEEVHYKRADNGGFHAKVHKVNAETGEMHKVEHHIIPNVEGAQEHFGDEMGDQPEAGAAPPEDAEAAAPGGAAPGAGGPGPMAA